MHVLHSRNPLLHIRLHCDRQTPLLAPCLLPSSTMTQGGYRMGVFKTTWKDLGRVLPQRTPRCSLSMPTAAILRTLPAPTTTTIFIKKKPRNPCHHAALQIPAMSPENYMYDGAEPAAYIKPQDEVCAQGFGWKKGCFCPSVVNKRRRRLRFNSRKSALYIYARVLH